MKLEIIGGILTLAATLGYSSEPDQRLQQAVGYASDIVVARVLEASPVGHGSNSVMVSFQIEPVRSLMGTNSLSGEWVQYRIQGDEPSFGSDYETSLQKNDMRVFILTNSALLRVESIEQESTVKEMILGKMKVQQSGPAYPPQGVGSADP